MPLAITHWSKSRSLGHTLPRALIPGADSIHPAIRRAEVTTRVSDYRRVQFLQGLDDVLAEAILIGQRVARVVDATVDAATHMPGTIVSPPQINLPVK